MEIWVKKAFVPVKLQALTNALAEHVERGVGLDDLRHGLLDERLAAWPKQKQEHEKKTHTRTKTRWANQANGYCCMYNLSTVVLRSNSQQIYSQQGGKLTTNT